MQRSHPTTQALIALALAFGQPSIAAHAQIPLVNSSAATQTGTAPICQDIGVVATVTCTTGTSTASATGSSAYGTLRAKATATGGTRLQGYATSHFADLLTFSGNLLPTDVVFYVALSGQLTGSGFGDGVASASFGINAPFQNLAGGFDFYRYIYQVPSGSSGATNFSQVGNAVMNVVQTGPQSWSIATRVTLPQNSPYFVFNGYLSTYATASGGSYTTDFFNTASLSSFQFFNGSTDVTSQVQVAAASGHQYLYGPPSSVTPEPASLILLSSGLAGVGSFARRKRRSACTTPVQSS